MIDSSTYKIKLQKRDKLQNHGFTLVEMIVVLVILTVLASILIPGLLGWIDEARGKQYVLSARSIYMSAQAVESEKYAAWDGTAANADRDLSDQDINRVLRMADAENAVIQEVAFESNSLGEDGASSNHGFFTIVGITVQYDGVTVCLADGIWTVIQ